MFIISFILTTVHCFKNSPQNIHLDLHHLGGYFKIYSKHANPEAKPRVLQCAVGPVFGLLMAGLSNNYF